MSIIKAIAVVYRAGWQRKPKTSPVSTLKLTKAVLTDITICDKNCPSCRQRAKVALRNVGALLDIYT